MIFVFVLLQWGLFLFMLHGLVEHGLMTSTEIEHGLHDLQKQTWPLVGLICEHVGLGSFFPIFVIMFLYSAQTYRIAFFLKEDICSLGVFLDLQLLVNSQVSVVTRSTFTQL